jgi:hypothetical protein
MRARAWARVALSRWAASIRPDRAGSSSWPPPVGEGAELAVVGQGGVPAGGGGQGGGLVVGADPGQQGAGGQGQQQAEKVKVAHQIVLSRGMAAACFGIDHPGRPGGQAFGQHIDGFGLGDQFGADLVHQILGDEEVHGHAEHGVGQAQGVGVGGVEAEAPADQPAHVAEEIGQIVVHLGAHHPAGFHQLAEVQAHHQADQCALLEGVQEVEEEGCQRGVRVEPAGRGVGQAVPRLQDVWRGRGVAEGLAEHRPVEARLVAKVVADGAQVHPRRIGDLAGRGLLVALVGKQLQRRFQQAPPCQRAVTADGGVAGRGRNVHGPCAAMQGGFSQSTDLS